MAKRLSWKNPPPVMAVTGTEGFLVRRELRKAIAAARATGRGIERVEGSDASRVADAMESGSLFGQPVLVVVSKPGKLDFDMVEEHAAEEDGSVCLLLYQEGKVRKGSALDKMAALGHHIQFNRPTQEYKVEEYAMKFVVGEAKLLGIELSTDLAEALVGKVGSNFGTLHFEMVKVAAYLDATDAGTQVTPAALKATMIRTGEANVAPLVDAVGKLAIKKMLREMGEIRRNFVGNERSRTLKTCGLLGNAATRWLHAAALIESGAGVDEAATRMSIHSYVYKRFTLPVAKRWGESALVTLVKRISRVENAVKSGHISPWSELECVLVASCRSVRARG